MNTLRLLSSRLSALLRIGALAAALMLPHGVRAQQGPLTTSPTAPTPFSWSTFHSGGTRPTALTAAEAALVPPNPLASQMQGTPTGLFGTSLTEIPSFLIGNYDFANGPAGVDGAGNILYFPNHFADDVIPGGTPYLSWSAPFTFLTATGQTTSSTPTLGHTSIVADDSQTTPTTYQIATPGVAATVATPAVPGLPSSGVDAGWTVLWTTSVTGTSANTWGAQIKDVTASGNPALPNNGTVTNTDGTTTIGQEYRRQPAVSAPIGSAYPAAAVTTTWTFTAPAAFNTFDAPAAPGLYSVVFHLPDPQTPKLADGTTANPNAPEYRIGDAHYVVRLNGVVVFDTDKVVGGKIVSRAAISQTETNDPQPLAGPFALKAADVLTVTLDNTTTLSITHPGTTYVLADSVSLVPSASAGGSARMDGSPTAINATDFPEIADALYYGFAVARDLTTGVVTQQPDNANAFGNKTIGTAVTATPNDTQHAIRQLVYFGRYEGIVLTNSAGALVDIYGNATTTPVTRMVGAIYCVDGINGGVVWRFQTSDVLNPNGTIAKPSAPVYTTPALARLNVRVNGTTIITKLCVVAADDNGLVYCLDAIGNRNGTDNGTVTDGTYNQPVFNPDAPQVGTSSAPDATGGHPHVGNTTAYWVYRPDAARPILQSSTVTPPATKNVDPTSDLPVPAAFGLASPTIYVNPNTAVDTTTLAPGAVTPTATLTQNGIVYIGNSNGTLYKLDATGVGVTETRPPTAGTLGGAATPGSGIFYSGSETYNRAYDYVLPITLGGRNPSEGTAALTALPTPSVDWWFAVNKAATNDATQTANVAITSAPSIFQQSFANVGTAASSTLPTPQHRIYFATSNETTNVGNVFSVLDTGPVNPSATSTGLTVGSTNYNTLARPDWSFPNAYTNTGDKIVHAALGSISGSPVVFTNPDDNTTRVYFAANQGPEGYRAERPVPAENGRIWAVDATFPAGATTTTPRWAYPDTFNPNADNAANTTTLGGATAAAEPLGTFRNASPAVGIVQFPAVIGYGTSGTTSYAHADSKNTSVLSAPVPMLYVGAHTEAADSSNFFALDLDGANDNQRNIHYIDNVNTTTNLAPVGQTVGPGFEASPLLVTNPGAGTPTSPTSGNGGVVFAVGSDGTLNELTATPLTDVGAGSVGPQFTNFAAIGGFGAFSSPAIAGFSNGALNPGTATSVPTAFVDTDWVYGGDSTLGIARGITPGARNSSGGTVDFGPGRTGVDVPSPRTIAQQFPLHVYLFDNKGHDPTSTNMTNANTLGSAIAAFEWGEKIYIRISNVVPPNPSTLANPTGDPKLYMADPTDKSVYYTNGGSVQVQLSDVDATGKIVPGRGADIATVNTTILPNLTDPNGNGFIAESNQGALDGVGDMLKSSPTATTPPDPAALGTGPMWLGATTYAIGDGSSRKNTPGSRRQIISATQTVEAHNAVADATHKVGDFLQTVTLSVNVNSSPNSFRRLVGGKPGAIKRIGAVDQPTFAVLNPLAVRGGGPNIPLGSASQVSQIDNVVGPFAGIDTSNPSTLTPDELVAYVNGNNGYVSNTDLPASGVLTGNGGGRGHRQFRPVTTATTDIPHGSIGNNGVPNATGLPGLSVRGSALGQGANTAFGGYAFDVADRSALGLNGGQISNMTVQAAPAEWNDNTTSYAGPGAVVNPLPWDDTPTSYRAGNNSSVDYPNIGKQRVSHTLNSNNGTSGVSVSDHPGTLDASPAPASGSSSSSADRTIQPDNINIEVEVPKYQPANLQLYEQTTGTTGGRISPAGLMTSTQTVYPMGYVARETVYVDSNHNGRRDDGEAYRTFRVFTGVPVDMSMTVADPTIDLGKLPQTFGVQTDTALGQTVAGQTTPSPLLGPFMPFQSTTALAVKGMGYQQYFKPIIAHNEGNINLLNVHFDQKLRKYTAAGSGGTTDSALPFGSDALDAQATLNAFDLNGVTGPSANTDPRKYILRTSLDADLAPYNRNPQLAAVNGPAYPNATFHKARVSDANPPILTVPDVPHDNAGAYSLPVSTAGLPVLGTTTAIPATHPLTAGMPYIGLAVPLGTPVGAYAQDVRLFEGIDPYAYPLIESATNTNSLYKPLFPPVYGRQIVANGATTPPGATTDMLTTIGSAVTQPYSNPTRVRATIVETRVTDGSTYGNLPQYDTVPATIPAAGTRPAIQGAADFLPVAFRSTYWSSGVLAGNSDLNLYWTSARGGTASVPYSLIGARVPFIVTAATQTTPAGGYFQADTANNRWYDPITSLAAPATNSFNTAISIAPDQHLFNGTNFNSNGTAYAFVQNVAAVPGSTGAAAYQNNLLCYQINPATGSITGSGVPVSADPSQPKFGARGLKFNATFTDPLPPPTGTTHATISNNLWAFWNGGSRGRSTMFYSASTTGDNGAAGAFSPAGALPLPAGLSGASDPSSVLVTATAPNGTSQPMLDVTYSGTNADGNTDVYVSRYQPYFVRTATGTVSSAVGLALTPSPAITEQLLPDTARQFYQARDVAWARADTLDVQINGNGNFVHLLQDTSKTQNADGSYPLYAGIKTSFDPASSTVVYTIPNSPVNGNAFAAGNGGTLRIMTIYADLVRGRVRFRTSYTASGGSAPSRFDVPLPDAYVVSATSQPQARRITIDRRADTEPVSFIDQAFKPNEAPGLSRVQTARYWFIWRKSAAPGTSTTPTIYTKTQRLTIYLNDGSNHPVPLPLTNGAPTLTMTDLTAVNTISSSDLAANVDVDWARGRLYFPLTINGTSVEGHRIHATFTYTDSQGKPQPGNVTDNVHWLDELRYNDPAAQPTGDPATTVDTNEHAVPIDVATNEGSPSAFLDPLAYADVAGGAYNPYSTGGGFTNPTTMLPNPDQPHKVWLFWNSTRSGTADVFYEALDPRFSANP